MNRIPSFLRRAGVLAAGCCLAFAAAADEVKVLAAGAFQPVVTAMVPVFEKRTGHKVALVNDSGGALAERIRAGEDFDLAVLPQPLLETLGKEGAVSDGSIIALARAAADRADRTIYAGSVSTSASNSQAALSLLILLASEETQAVLKNSGLAAP